MLDDFLLRAGLAGVGVAIAAGPLGCFVLWRRMVYFGDATAHAAILGVAIALTLDIAPFLGVLLIAVLMAWAVSGLSDRGLEINSLLGVAAHSSLALGLVAYSLSDWQGVGLEAYLFGEILAVTVRDLAVIWGGALAVVGLLIWRWRALLTSTLNPDLAVADGTRPERETLVLSLALALVVAIALKVVGALLITAMLIIPAAAARPLARTPEVMAVMALVLGAAAAIGGLQVSLALDTPTGPTIVTVASALFGFSLLIARIRGGGGR